MRNFIIFVGLILIGCVKNSDFATSDLNVDEFNQRAMKVLKPKCQDGILSACNDLGISLQSTNQHQKAIQFYQKACDLGYQYSCTNLANAYLKGQGVSKDEKRAEQIYKNSCASGGAYSCYFLGEFYRVNQNFSSAASAYTNGCKLGDMPSCVNLGGLYELGAGVKQDKQKAINIYKNACQKSELAGCENLQRLKE